MLLLLGTSAAALACPPLFLPENYSWIAHTTSQGAGQGVSGAWLSRIGFVTFGTAVLWIAVNTRDRWPLPGRYAHIAFGLFMLTAAAFSSRPWEDTAAFDVTEDLLHSIAASGMGLAFAVDVLAVAGSRYRLRARGGLRLLDVVAVAASVVIPLSMLGAVEMSGFLQRMMFLIAYIWYAREALL